MASKKLPKFLATASSEAPCTTPLGSGTLLTELEVMAHKDYKCCKRVEATFFFTPDAPKSPRKKRCGAKAAHSKPEQETKEIGYIVAYIIDKTATKKNTGEVLWLEELASAKPDRKGNVSEVVKMMQMLYGPKGGVRHAFRKYANDLKGERMVHLDTLWIEGDYRGGRGNGAGSVGLRAFHELLLRLTNDYAFSGTVVLSPATPTNEVEDLTNKGKDLQQQEEWLVGKYESEDYETWLRGAKEEEGSISIMGRNV